MLNKSGISKTTLTTPKQILADVKLQSSVGCIVSQTLGVDVSGKKIAKAGTPITVDLLNLKTVATAGEKLNAVLLHDVDVTSGDANGTALIFGFVNVNRLDSDVVVKVKAAGEIGKVTFISA